MDKSILEDGGEWISSKKVVNHKTRQVETRIQRQLIMEDGKVIADSGPQVTIRTKEDNWTEEAENSAKKGLPMDVESIESSKSGSTNMTKVVINESDPKVISEKVETKNTIREAKHERFQYHDESISELTGFDLHQKALVSPNDLLTVNCDAIDVKQDGDIDQLFNGSNLLSPKGKLTHYSSKSHKVTDKEEVKEISKVGPDGEIVKETVRTSHHEEVSDDEQPEDDEKDKVSDKSSKIKSKESEIVTQESPSKKKIIYTQNSPITSSPMKENLHHHHHRRLNDHPIYDIAGKADHTNKWIESHFGSSDSSQHDKVSGERGLNSSSNGSSIVDRRGRPRQRMNPEISQSYDEAYYSNTIGGNGSNNSSKLTSTTTTTTTDKVDCSISSSPPVDRRYNLQQLKGKQRDSNTIGCTKLNETGNRPTLGSGYSNNNSPSESSISSYLHDYHHSSEGSLSPSALTNHQHQHQHHNHNHNHQHQPSLKHQLYRTNNSNESLINKRWSSIQLLNCKPVNSTINSHVHSNSRNLLLKVKNRVPKEDASVQASLSDEEIDCDQFKESTNYGKQSIDYVNNGSKDLNNNNRPRPMRTYYFGESVQSDYSKPSQQQLKSNQVDRDDDATTVYRLSSRFPANDLLRSKLIHTLNQDDEGRLIEPFDTSVNHVIHYDDDDDDEDKLSQSLNCLNDQRLINGSVDCDGSSRTDLFQTRDYGSLSNWRSTINLRSNGLTTIGRPFNGNQSKDDSFTRDFNNNFIQSKPNYRDSLNRVTLRKGHLGSVNNISDHHHQAKLDQISGQRSGGGLSPIQERKSDLALDNNLNLLLSRGSTYWPEFNPLKSSTPINVHSNNPKGTYKVSHKHRTPINRTFFKAH